MRLLSDGIMNPNFIRFVKVLIFDKSRFHFTAVDWKVIQLVIYSGMCRNRTCFDHIRAIAFGSYCFFISEILYHNLIKQNEF